MRRGCHSPVTLGEKEPVFLIYVYVVHGHRPASCCRATGEQNERRRRLKRAPTYQRVGFFDTVFWFAADDAGHGLAYIT